MPTTGIKSWILWLAPALLLCGGQAGALESEDCLACHGEADEVGEALTVDAAAFSTTAHAELGCTGCHQGIDDQHPDGQGTSATVACAECHGEIEAEYASSTHAAYAGCTDCHSPHAARGPTEVSGADMNRVCAGCHDPAAMTESHGSWLPQSALHMEALPCITCHTGSKEYGISFYFVPRQQKRIGGDFEPASHAELLALTNGRPLEELIDLDGDGQISIGELRRFHLAKGTLRLHGMMTPRQVTHSFQTLDNRWDCSFCHASGPRAMQQSALSIPEADGRFRQVPVESGAVLDALFGTPDFYMVGATRSRALDLVGLAILAGGLVMPIGHGTLRLLTRRNRNEGDRS